MPIRPDQRTLLAAIGTGTMPGTGELATDTGSHPRTVRIELARLWAAGIIAGHPGPDGRHAWTLRRRPRGYHRVD